MPPKAAHESPEVSLRENADSSLDPPQSEQPPEVTGSKPQPPLSVPAPQEPQRPPPSPKDLPKEVCPVSSDARPGSRGTAGSSASQSDLASSQESKTFEERGSEGNASVEIETDASPKTNTSRTKTITFSQDLERPSGRGSFRTSSELLPRKRTTIIRQQIKRSRWYHGALASKLRFYVHHKRFSGLMFLCLLWALFAPELWVLFGINSNTILDVVLTLTMFLFVFEIFALSLLDATYLMSFFFYMDILGTVSMVFHVSFMFGIDNTEADAIATNTGKDTEQTLMLLRAARAARIGARIGRVSRAVRLLRFLPFLANVSDPNSEAITDRVSGQLANLLAIRVAALTVILVMLIPLLDIFAFPQTDLALIAWAERLSADWAEGATTLFYAELNEMVQFFSRHDYGPYMACHGRQDGDVFVCTEDVVGGWSPLYEEPPRAASAMQVHTDTFMVGYNMHTTFLLEHGLAIVNIFFTIGIMIFCGLALSSVVNELAVRPLERMLQTVRTIARTVFKFSADIVDQEEDADEEYNVETSNEMKLLEAVVGKLAIVAELANAAQIQVDAEMGDEEIGILSLMKGSDVVQDKRTQAERRVSAVCKISNKSGIRMFIQSQIPRLGVTLEVYGSFNYNTLPLTAAQMVATSVYAIASFHEHDEGFVTNMDQMAKLQRFITSVETNYLPNPFHSFHHATDVLHGVARMMRIIQTEKYLTPLEQYSLLVAAIGHDLAHPGVNNGFLAEVGHELALQYNDISPLENMHVSKLYSLLVVEELNVFSMLSQEQYKEVRRYCIETILHTDMMLHQAMVKDLQMLYQMNLEVLEQNDNAGKEYDIFCRAENKMLAMQNILHSADVSNPCRTWLVCHAWAHQVLEEFFAQGDQEKMLGVPVQFLNDRDKLDRPNSQIGFLEFMIVPFFCAQIRLFPRLSEYGDNLKTNIAMWEEIWEKDSSPNEDLKEKTRARVEKVKVVIEEAKNCRKMT